MEIEVATRTVINIFLKHNYGDRYCSTYPNITIAISKPGSMPVTDFLNGIEGMVG